MKCDTPNCKHPHEMEIDVPDPVKSEITAIPTTTAPQQQMMMTPPPEPKERKITHEEITDLMPPGVNFMKCPGEKCGRQVLKNKKQVQNFLTCPECDHNGFTVGSGLCEKCGKKFTKDEEEDFDDGIEIEEE